MKSLVTGGGGFLGSRLAQKLLEQGAEVTVLGRRNYIHLSPQIKMVQLDIRDRDAVLKAVEGHDTVFHAASIPGIWGNDREFFSINVDGTRNVIDACLAHNVSRLIYTSSPSVVYGQKDMFDVDESTPYPQSYLCSYSRTKALAEKQVMSANGEMGLRTISLRPHLIWGPGDTHLVPRIIQKAESGRLVQVGDGDNRVSIVYIDNAVDAHLLACRALQDGKPVGGNCYFITDGDPVLLWKWIKDLLEALDLPPVTKRISCTSARILGGAMELIYGVMRIKSEPPMTRFLASQLSTSHYYKTSRAKKDLGYVPRVGPEEGMQKLIEYFKSQKVN